MAAIDFLPLKTAECRICPVRSFKAECLHASLILSFQISPSIPIPITCRGGGVKGIFCLWRC